MRRSQCVDLILGFLELVGNPPGSENSEIHELQSLKVEQAGETFPWGTFLRYSCVWEYQSVVVVRFCNILALPGSLYILYVDSLWGTLCSVLQKKK